MATIESPPTLPAGFRVKGAEPPALPQGFRVKGQEATALPHGFRIKQVEPTAQPEQRTFAEAVGRPFKAEAFVALEAWNRGWGQYAQQLEELTQFVNDKIGTSDAFGKNSSGFFQSIADAYNENADFYADKARKNDPTFVDELIGEALGGVIPGVSQFVTFNPALAGAVGAAEAKIRGESELVGFFMESAKRGVLGAIFQGLAPFEKSIRAPVMAAVFGLEAGLAGGSPREVAKATGIGLGLGVVSPTAKPVPGRISPKRVPKSKEGLGEKAAQFQDALNTVQGDLQIGKKLKLNIGKEGGKPIIVDPKAGLVRVSPQLLKQLKPEQMQGVISKAFQRKDVDLVALRAKVPIKAKGEVGKVEVAIRGQEITKQEVFNDVPVSDIVEPAIARAKRKGPLFQRLKKRIKGELEPVEKQSWEMVRDYYRRRWGLEFRFQNTWSDIFTKPGRFGGRKQRFSDKVLEDMIFYRQRTKNPFVDQILKSERKPGDTFESVSSRLSKEQKAIVDKTIDEHFKNWLKTWNESPVTKDIDPRAHIAEIYLPGIYTNSPGALAIANNKAMSVVTKRFKTNNPFANKKTFETYSQALEEAGLVPRYRNMQDLLNHYDRLMVRLLANNEFIQKIRTLEKETGQRVIVRSNQKDLYQTAAKEGWIPFQDPYLRSRVAGITKDGKPIWAVTEAPALLHPEFAGSVRAVFQKDAYRPENLFWRKYDSAASYLRYLRVSLSGFHGVALTESLLGARGARVLNVLNPRSWTSQGTNWMKDTSRLLNDPVVMEEAIGAGLKLQSPVEAARGKVEGDVQSLRNWLDLHGKKGRAVSKSIGVVTAPQKWITHVMFDVIHPRFKILSYHEYKSQLLLEMNKKGIVVDAKKLNEINNEVARIVNNQFGHQAWELIRIMNDPTTRKWTHRFVGYPDWTISALRQATDVMYPGAKGKLARQYWLRYGIAFLTMQQAMSYMNTGMKDDPDGGISWDIDKAHSTFENNDPIHKFDFQLPDVNFNVLGVKFNPGRDERGRRLYSHFGKQMLEIPRYATNTIAQLFSKSNPLIQLGLTQAFGGTPYQGGVFPARGKFVGGEFRAWDGTRGVTIGRTVSRAKQLVGSSLPFSIQSARQRGLGTAGLLPISKGLGLRQAEPFVEDALRNNDTEAIRDLIKVLEDNDYSIATIKRFFRTINTRIAKEKGAQ